VQITGSVAAWLPAVLGALHSAAAHSRRLRPPQM
jgi:hypothetical protein